MQILAYSLIIVALVTQAGQAAAQTDALQRLLVAEDARGTGAEGLQPLTAALSGSDTLMRRLAVRGLGRLQRPELGKQVLAFLADTVPAVRVEAANAIAQALRRTKRSEPDGSDNALGTREAAAALIGALGREADPRVVDALGQSLGRLPLPDTAAARTAEDAIRARFSTSQSPGLAHGLYTLARARRATGTLTPATIELLRRSALRSADTVVRRLSLLTLAAAGGLDSVTALRAFRDRDAESRRMTLRGAGALSASLRAALVRQAMRDPDRIVRTEAAATARLGEGMPDCRPILALTRDREPYVALTAIDSLGSGCADIAGAARALARLVTARVLTGPADHRWQQGAHALLALARLDTAAARPLLPAVVSSGRAEVRAYAARVAALLRERSVLLGLAGDDDHNVQEAAIAGLASAAGRDADSVYIRALGSSGNQVALAAATALEGTTDTAAALPALLQAFDDLSARRSENARDPRVAILTRIGDLGSAATASRLTPYLADFDTTVAVQVATLLSKWRGSTVLPRPTPLPIRAEPLARLFTSPPARLRVTMAPSSGGGSFTVRLWADETPATVARVLRLAREGFYDGKVFQRVEPNFVIQGGGPDANEYVGDDAFMRDELTMRTHARGTLGISARGRDTGDGQWFVNLVDNPLLDHEFTIFGRIDGGQAVAERLLEGDRIARVEVVESPTGADHWLTTADSVRLYYRVLGAGTETVIAPLALFHAGQLDALARSRRLVLYDPRGRGRSDTVPAAKISLDRNVADLDAIRAAVGAERIALIGWSGLGMELFVYALRHPDRVTRLVQLAPVAPRWTPWSDSLGTDRARRTDSAALSALRARERRGVYRDNPANHCRAIAAVYSPATFGDPTRAHLAPDVCGRPTEWPERINGYFTALMGSIEGFDWTDSLAKVAGTPRLVIHGALDNTPVNGNREWVAGQPNARILIVDGAGHWPHYERSDEVLPALDEFLGGGWPDGSAAIR